MNATRPMSLEVGPWRVVDLGDFIVVLRDDGVVVVKFHVCDTWDAWDMATQCARALLNHHAPISSGVSMFTAPRIP